MDYTTTEWRCYLNVVQNPEIFGKRTALDLLAACWLPPNRRLEAGQACVGFKHIRLLLLKSLPNINHKDLPNHPDAIGAAWELTLANKLAVPDYAVAFFCNNPEPSADEFNSMGQLMSSMYRLKHKKTHTQMYLGTAAIPLFRVDEFAQQIRLHFLQGGFLIGVRDCEGFALELYRSILHYPKETRGPVRLLSVFWAVAMFLFAAVGVIWCCLFFYGIGPSSLRIVLGYITLALYLVCAFTFTWDIMDGDSGCYAAVRFQPHMYARTCMEVYDLFQSTILLVKEELIQLRTKLRHVDIHNHWLRQEVTQGRIDVIYTPSAQLLADGFTKSLPREGFETFIKQLRLADLSARLARNRKQE